MDERDARWPQAWVRAALDLAILGCLVDDDLHGYAIAQRLAERGMGRLKGGSLYPVLARLEQAGLVEAVWEQGESGPGRKAYSLTPAGHEERGVLLSSWRELTEALAGRGARRGHESSPVTKEVVR